MNKVLEFWSNLKIAYKIGIIASIVAIVVLFSFLSAKPDNYSVLYSNLDQRDSQEITKELVKMGVDYKIEEEGATILIDGDKTSAVRISLANAGLPNTGNPGFEMLETSSIGDTRYDKEKKYAMALKGQLERDLVNGIEVIQSANVQLTLAEQTSIFQNEGTESKATVSVGITKGQRLDETQVRGIQNFVAGAIRNIEAKDVVVLNTNGELLSSSTMDSSSSSFHAFTKQDQIVAQTEERVKTDIMKSLSKIFGYDHVTVNVRAEINFDEIVKNIEKYDPEGTLVSSQVNKENTEKNDGTPIVEPGVEGNGDVPDYQSSNGDNGASLVQNKEEIIENFEVGKTVETIKKNPELTNMSVVVWVDQDMKDSEVETLAKAIATSAGIKDSDKDGEYDNGEVDVIPVVFKQNTTPDTTVTEEAPLTFFEKLFANEKLLMTIIGLFGMLLIFILLLVIFGKGRKPAVVYKETEIFETSEDEVAVQNETQTQSVNPDDQFIQGINQQKNRMNQNLNDATREKQKYLLDEVRKASEDVDKSKEFIKQKLREE